MNRYGDRVRANSGGTAMREEAVTKAAAASPKRFIVLKTAAFASAPSAAAAAPASHAAATATSAARPSMLLRSRLGRGGLPCTLHVTRLRLGSLHVLRLSGLLRIARLLLRSLRVLRLSLLFRCGLFRLGILSGGFPFGVGTALGEV